MKHEKPELSRKNPYRLPKYRYLELKNFCFQYNDWKRALARLDGWRAQEGDMGGIVKSNIPSDPTAREGMLRAYYSQHIELIDRCIAKLEPALQTYILKGVTEGLSYRNLRVRGCVIQQRYNEETKATYWGPIDPWLTDKIYLRIGFKEYFDAHAKKKDSHGYFPTVTVRQLMWALRMKPLKKERWETSFDHVPI